MAIDVYLWRAYRLHSLDKPTPVSWGALHAQFGRGYARMDHFRERFLDTLILVETAFPEAMVAINGKCRMLPKGGLVLHPSPPPVRPKIGLSAGKKRLMLSALG